MGVFLETGSPYFLTFDTMQKLSKGLIIFLSVFAGLALL